MAQTFITVRFPTPFFVRSYQGKCLDFGTSPPVTGAPVFIYGCNGTTGQQVVVEEINDRHEVALRAGNKIIGVKNTSVFTLGGNTVTSSGASNESEIPLELQDVDRLGLSGAQIFALDGDSIILASDHGFVVKIHNGRAADRTPLVLGRRSLADSEFWTLTPVDGSAVKPTSGFVRIPGDRDQRSLADQFMSAVMSAKRGTVIELDPGISIDLQYYPAVQIREGVTIRGDRRGTLLGPELRTSCPPFETFLEVDGDDVRITGLRIHGPSRDASDDICKAIGIGINDFSQLRTVIDHNDISDFTTAGVFVAETGKSIDCSFWTSTRPHNTRIARNFIHHNEQQNAGYGVAANQNSYPFIDGNTFLQNRHAIKGGAEANTGYRAWYNLVLSSAPWQYDPTGTIPLWHTQDFDVHGFGDNGYGTRGGYYFEISRNTFLGTDRENFELRGPPCVGVDFRDNVSLRHLTPWQVSGGNSDPLFPAVVYGDYGQYLTIYGGQFGAANPTRRFGVGDFDGDGREDLFLATGAAWYYAPAGVAEWRYLNAQTDGIGSLLFGDFDGDGRTDVFTMNGRDWLVSWGGASNWEKINQSDPRLADFAIGDFDGDHRADVFYADGQAWYVSFGGVAPFKLIDTSSFRISDLRFGDFNNDGKTDIFAVANGAWSVTYGGQVNWTPLRPKLTNSVAGLVVADFNGDGRADVARSDCSFFDGCSWQVSYSGIGDWVTLRSADVSLDSVAAVGCFDTERGADILLWHDNYLDIASGGYGASRRHSNQDMR